MATSDLCTELGKSLKIEPQLERKICAAVLKQLDDTSNDVQVGGRAGSACRPLSAAHSAVQRRRCVHGAPDRGRVLQAQRLLRAVLFHCPHAEARRSARRHDEPGHEHWITIVLPLLPLRRCAALSAIAASSAAAAAAPSLCTTRCRHHHQGIAVKCLGILLKKVQEAQVCEICDKLVALILDDKKPELRDIYSIGELFRYTHTTGYEVILERVRCATKWPHIRQREAKATRHLLHWRVTAYAQLHTTIASASHEGSLWRSHSTARSWSCAICTPLAT
jgi:hypothetical protein